MEFVAKQKNFGNPSRRTSLQILNFQINDEFDRFFNILKNSPETDGIFNLWYEIDSINGRSSAGPDIRKQQFYHYLKERLDLAQYLFVGEAPGYQGGHFTGIPMTSERILLGYKQESGVAPESVFREIAPQRTSKNEIQPKGFTEPTATIVWGAIASNKIDPPGDFQDPVVPPRIMKRYTKAYLGSGDPTNPLISPVFADLSGLPPLLVHVGEEETLREDALRITGRAEAAGVDVRLEIYPRMWHVWQLFPGLPQAEQSREEIADFLLEQWGE